MKTAYKVGSLWIHLANIDYINEGDGTSYDRPYIVLKSGKRISIDDDFAGFHKLLEAWQDYQENPNAN